MRTILLDLGPMAHLSGNGSLKGADISDSELLTSPAGKGIVIEDGIIVKIDDSKSLEDEYGSKNLHHSKSDNLENKIYEEIKSSNPEIIDSINNTGKLEDEVEKKLTLIIEQFKKINK